MDKKNVKILSALCLVAALAVMGIILNLPTLSTPSFREEKMVIHSQNHDVNFNIEIAETPRQKEYGFMNRKNIPADHGMLFIWPKELHITMWMKDTPSPLDMLFIDHDGKIVYIFKNATPYSEKTIDPKMSVRAVIELVGGTANANEIKVGDHVDDTYFHPAAHP